MKLFVRDDKGELHWSPEVNLQVYMMLIFIFAAQLISHRLCRRFELEKQNGGFIQKRAHYLNEALRNAKAVITNLEAGYDKPFELVIGDNGDKFEAFRKTANDYILLFGLYQNRKEARPGRMFKTMSQIKNYIRSIPGTKDYDVDETLSYYK